MLLYISVSQTESHEGLGRECIALRKIEPQENKLSKERVEKHLDLNRSPSVIYDHQFDSEVDPGGKKWRKKKEKKT